MIFIEGIERKILIDMQKENPICLCQIPADLQKSEMFKAIANYVNQISEELRTEDRIYERRLMACSQCDALIGGLTCKYCGCFVLARARKKSQSCPMPGKDCWEKMDNY